MLGPVALALAAAFSGANEPADVIGWAVVRAPPPRFQDRLPDLGWDQPRWMLGWTANAEGVPAYFVRIEGQGNPATARAAVRTWLRHQGFVVVDGLTGVPPASAEGRARYAFETPGAVGWASTPAAAGLGGRLSSAEVVTEGDWPQGSYAVGQVVVPRLYGMLARTRQGSQWASAVRYLGLGDLERVRWHLRSSPNPTLQVHAKFRTEPRTGLMAALGRVPVVAPAGPLPRGVLGLLRIAVAPQTVHRVLMAWWGRFDPLRFGLVQAQLAASEERVGIRLDDALGAAEQVASVWFVGPGQIPEPVLTLPVAHGHKLDRLLADMLAPLPLADPRFQLIQHEDGGRRMRTLLRKRRSWVTSSAEAKRWGVARTSQALARVPTVSPPKLATPEANAVMCGQGRLPGMATFTAIAPRGFTLAAEAAALWPQGRVRGCVRRVRRGFSLKLRW